MQVKPFILSCVSLLAIGCTTTTVRIKRASKPPVLADREDGLFKASGVTSLYIEDDWSGDSPLSPTVQRYELRRGSDAFVGQGRIALGTEGKRQVQFPLTIPAKVMREFLYALSGASGTEGEYEPYDTSEVSQPSRRIELTMADGRNVIFVSESEGIDNLPWGVKLDDTLLILSDATPAHALLMVFPFLRPDIMRTFEDELIAELERQG